MTPPVLPPVERGERGDPCRTGTLGIAFIVLWIAATLFRWVDSPAFISHFSMVALVYAAFGDWQAARAEEKADSDSSD